MNKALLGKMLLLLVFVLPAPALARADVNVSISLPPIAFPGPPLLVVIPQANVYAVPDVNDDLFLSRVVVASVAGKMVSLAAA